MMDSETKGTIKVLSRLLRLNRNSEEGFRVAAESVKNRGLKTLLKAYAQQRAQFATELQAEVTRLGGSASASGSLLGVFHRGWIIIKAALTIGPQNTENVVLAEAHRGENYAVRQYRRALGKELLPAVREMVDRQYETIQQASSRVYSMKGNRDGRLVVRLFDHDEDVSQAINDLQGAGFAQDSISTMVFNRAISLYGSDVKRATLVETASAGALGGAVIGVLLGLVAAGMGAGVMTMFNMSFLELGTSNLFVGVTVGGLIVGALFGMFLGILIGLGISEEDSYLYDDSVKRGKILMMVQTDNDHAPEASAIMQRINLASAHR